MDYRLKFFVMPLMGLLLLLVNVVLLLLLYFLLQNYWGTFLMILVKLYLDLNLVSKE